MHSLLIKQHIGAVRNRPFGSSWRSGRSLIVLVVMSCACSAIRGAPLRAPQTVVSDSFEDWDTIPRQWVIDFQGDLHADAQIARDNGNSFMSLSLPAGSHAGELIARRSLELGSLRRQRIQLSARIRFTKSSDTTARVRLSAPSSSGIEAYSDFADSDATTSDSWMTVYSVIDVPSTAERGEVALILNGPGEAWFDDVRLVALGPSPLPTAAKLSAILRERLITLARVLALVRYFHPSDQVAALDWNTFSTRAVDTVLHADETTPLIGILTTLFSEIAPTARFVEPGERAEVNLIRAPNTTHLVRWYQQGLAGMEPSDAYYRFREGIEAEETTSTYVHAIANIPHPETCGIANIRARARTDASVGSAQVVANLLQSAVGRKAVRQTIALPQPDTTALRVEIPEDIRRVELGITLVGRARVEVQDISLVCQNGEVARVDAQSNWILTGANTLYRKEIATCDRGVCMVAYRVPLDTEFRPRRDVTDVEIGNSLHILLPIAVWSDGKNTFPRGTINSLPSDTTITDLSMRLAAVITAWNTLLWFYPYFKDQRIDWSRTLPRALDEVAAATSPKDTHAVLSRLISGLQDGHARVRHPTQALTGLLPLALRKFGGQFMVVGGLEQYTSSVPMGSELVSVDGTAIEEIYGANYASVSAATPAFREYLALLSLSAGKMGSLKHLKLRSLKKEDFEVILPLVSRELSFDDIRERRPKSGTEIAPSVLYVDPMTLDHSAVVNLIPLLTRSRAVIVDVRGYITNSVFEFLAHFLKQDVQSPKFEVPIITTEPVGQYEDVTWSLRPASPFVSSKMIVLIDARAASAAETFLQIVRDNRLAIFVGEPTAGTNGDVNTFQIPGGFMIRFTGLRVSDPDGVAIQGHGITPDVPVRPTVDGIRNGRDEILEAAVTIAEEAGHN